MITSIVVTKIPNPGIVMRKKSKQAQIEEHSTKYCTSTLQKCQSHEKQRKTKEFTDIGGD